MGWIAIKKDFETSLHWLRVECLTLFQFIFEWKSVLVVRWT